MPSYEYRVVRKPLAPLLAHEKDEWTPVKNYKGKAGPYQRRQDATAFRKYCEKNDRYLAGLTWKGIVVTKYGKALPQESDARYRILKGYVYKIERRPIGDWEDDD